MTLPGKRVIRGAPASPVTEDDLRLADEVSAIGEGLGSVASPDPGPALRSRLMASLSATHRFPDFEARIAKLVELSPDRVRNLLLGIDTAETWQGGPVPGLDFYHFEGGPSVSNAITGFTRVAAGVTFPEHEHVGEECVLVMQGAFRDADGEIYGAGDEVWLPPGSIHHYEVVSAIPLLYLAIVQGGLRVGGMFIPPGDPRA